MTRRDHAIMMSRQDRAAKLLPLRTEIDAAIDALGWRRAKPVVCEVLGLHVAGQRGAWWAKVGGRNGPKLLAALKAEASRELPGQRKLF